MTNGVWFVEFRSSRPFVPTKYYMVPGKGAQNDPWNFNENPYNWRLMAKTNEGDQWTTIATVTNDERLPAGYDRPDNESIQKRVEYPLDVTGKTWQYFRLEILNTRHPLGGAKNGYEGYLKLAEFDFGKNE